MGDQSTMLRMLKEIWADKGCLFISCIMLFIFSSAIYGIFSPTERKYREGRLKIEKQEDSRRAAICGFDYKTFKFKNHSYIVFTINEGTYSFNCPVVHDPDCPCHEKESYSLP